MSLFLLYCPLTSCKKAKKSLEPFSGKSEITNYYYQLRDGFYRTTPVQKSEIKEERTEKREKRRNKSEKRPENRKQKTGATLAENRK